MDLLKVAKLINLKIEELEKLKSDLEPLARDKALKMAQYDLVLAKTIITLRSGVSVEMEGIAVKEESVSLMDKLAKGVIWKEKMEMDLSESLYKNCIKKIDITEAQLNGFQSINRYLSEV